VNLIIINRGKKDIRRIIKYKFIINPINKYLTFIAYFIHYLALPEKKKKEKERKKSENK
jgi:hypothetical protein